MNPKRVLQVTSVLNRGGIETFLVNVLRKLNRNEIVFDFLVTSEDIGIFEDEIYALGGRIYKIPSLKKVGIRKFKRNLDSFFSKHNEYQIVHSHINAWSYFVLKSAKKHNIPTRIAHSHTSDTARGFWGDRFVSYCKRRIYNFSTDLFACSEEAAEFLFGDNADKTIILTNGIDTEKFCFSPQAREKTRLELGISNEFVIITIGRFSKEKNHAFFLDVLAEIKKKCPSVIWICIGEGKMLDLVKKKAELVGVSDNVIFLNSRDNIADYLSASDVYVGTSLFEGFGISAVEAQCNGLPCVLSDGFPKSCKLNSNCVFISLKASKSIWGNEVLSSSRLCESSPDISNCYDKFSVNRTAKYLYNYYLEH